METIEGINIVTTPPTVFANELAKRLLCKDNKPLWEIDPDTFLNPYKELPPVLTWCKIGDRPALDRSGIILVTASKKEGKSRTVNAFLLPLLRGAKFSNITPEGEPPKLVIVFDTEMDEPTLQGRIKKIYNNLPPGAFNFQVVPLLKVPLKNRRELFENIIDEYNPDIVVIDTVDRMVADYNNGVECADFGQWVAHFAGDRTVFCVIHQNKNKETPQTRGALGSILEELCVEAYRVKRDKNITTVEAFLSRSRNIEDAEDFAFTVDADANIIDPTELLEQKRKKEFEGWKQNFERLFDGDLLLRYSELIERIKDKDNLEKTAAETKIKTATEMGVIEKTGEDKQAPYKLNHNATPKTP